MAPEIYDPKLCNKGYNPEQSDLFSLGVILFAMYIGKPPFNKPDPRKDQFFQLLAEHKYAKFWQIWEDSDWAQTENL